MWPTEVAKIDDFLAPFRDPASGLAKLAEAKVIPPVLQKFRNNRWRPLDAAREYVRTALHVKVTEAEASTNEMIREAQARLASDAGKQCVAPACWELHPGFCAGSHPEAINQKVCNLAALIQRALKGVPKKNRWQKLFRFTTTDSEPAQVVFAHESGGKLRPAIYGFVLCKVSDTPMLGDPEAPPSFAYAADSVTLPAILIFADEHLVGHGPVAYIRLHFELAVHLVLLDPAATWKMEEMTNARRAPKACEATSVHYDWGLAIKRKREKGEVPKDEDDPSDLINASWRQTMGIQEKRRRLVGKQSLTHAPTGSSTAASSSSAAPPVEAKPESKQNSLDGGCDDLAPSQASSDTDGEGNDITECFDGVDLLDVVRQKLSAFEFVQPPASPESDFPSDPESPPPKKVPASSAPPAPPDPPAPPTPVEPPTSAAPASPAPSVRSVASTVGPRAYGARLHWTDEGALRRALGSRPRIPIYRFCSLCRKPQTVSH